MRERIAECINILGGFCGKRDVPSLRSEELRKRYGIEQADVMVLFGGSILCGGDVLAEAMKQHIAENLYHCGRSRAYNRDSEGEDACRISEDRDSRIAGGQR